MYRAKPGIKKDHVRCWALPDRIFFGHGACHILAGVYLGEAPLAGFHAERIMPHGDVPGGHMYVTDGTVAFDYHGYSLRQRLLDHHRRAWSTDHPGWDYEVERVDFPILGAHALNARKMLGPGQYLENPIPRASAFIARYDHQRAAARARG
ncbi:hypothetical protein [Devosia sediminis]|uniref:Uncharacterized protein n=1 Tax=Devosia sediminis TaxID=2798801 RepID=A0A934MGG9_9HYPH|nr:hypothetical protein [Devosia sediminis]MBJ3783932.1 hypothetical protein [Devosia sediminis]